jgi:hypothetical protein
MTGGDPAAGTCGRCTGLVRVLSVGTASFRRHTGHMATDAGATPFVTEAAGFRFMCSSVERPGRGWRISRTVHCASFEWPTTFWRMPVFSNIRCADSASCFLYPTLEHGLQHVVGVLNE